MDKAHPFQSTRDANRLSFRLPNWLGDVIMALPLIHSVQKAQPNTSIQLWSPRAFLPLLKLLELGMDIVALPPKSRYYFMEVKKMQVDHEISPHYLFTHSLRGDLEGMMLKKSPMFGVQLAGRWRPLVSDLYKIPANYNLAEVHQVRLWEQAFRHFGLTEAVGLKPFSLGSESEDGLHIGLICGSENNPEKRWPVEQWRELIDLLLKEHGEQVRISLYGTPRETEITAEVAKGYHSAQVVDLAGKTNLEEFAKGISSCQQVIGNDTGGMHIANCLGVPVVALFGPTNPVRTGPAYDADKVILQPEGCPQTGGDELSRIPASKVIEASLSLSHIHH